MPNLSDHSDPHGPTAPLSRRLTGGEVLTVAGNKPLNAVDSNSFWIVTRGEADVFVVRFDGERPVGVRTHLFRAGEGDLLFGVSHQGPTHDMGFVAVGKPGTELTRFDRSALNSALSSEALFEPAASAVESWIVQLSRAVTKESPPSGKYHELEAKTTVLAESGQIIRSHADVLWVRPVAGKGLLAGDDALPTLDSRILFPLTRNLWLQSMGPTQISGFSSRDVIKGKEFNGAFNRFHETVFRCIATREEKTEAWERMRFNQRFTEDRRKLQNALFRLGAMLFRGAETALPPSLEGKPLLSAAMAVAEACGIQTGNLLDALSEKSGELRLEDIARTGNFFTRQTILRIGWSREDNGPLLGRFREEEGHGFVALIPVSPRRYELFDPEGGTRVPVTRELEEHLDPVAHTFYRPLPPKSLSIRDIMEFTLSGAWKDLLTVMGLGAAGGVLALLIPVMTGVIVDTVIPNAERSQLQQIGFILMVSVFAAFMFQITRTIAMVRLKGRMGAMLQAAVIDRMVALPVPFFRKFTAGDLANRALGINEIRRILSGATLTTGLTCIFSSFNLILMFFYGWGLALMGLSLVLITFLISGALSAWMIRYQREVFSIQGENAGLVLQLLTGITKLRLTGTEERGFDVWAKSFSKKKAIDFKSGKINAALDTTTSFIPLVASMVIFWFFLKSKMTGLSTGHFLAFNAAFVNLQNAVVQATLTFAGLLHVIPLWERAKPILSTIPEVDEAKTKVHHLTGQVVVDHVTFRYSENGPRVLRDINLEISPGEFVAVVGGSGSGKSTLLRILLGFEKPESGSVYYDGQDLEGLDIKGIRRQMGVVLQRGQVMPGNIFENISGALNLTLDDAWEAVRMVGLEEDIRAMPMGMHTVLSAGGGTLSGGQRQRLIIARAIVRRPRILFFDEATSALDNRTQAIVSNSIEKLNVTRLVIAHRLSTIMNADRIYVLEKGEVRESGTYGALMKKKEAFHELAKRQIA